MGQQTLQAKIKYLWKEALIKYGSLDVANFMFVNDVISSISLFVPEYNYRKVSNIRRTRSQNLNASQLIL